MCITIKDDNKYSRWTYIQLATTTHVSKHINILWNFICFGITLQIKNTLTLCTKKKNIIINRVKFQDLCCLCLQSIDKMYTCALS